MITRVGVLLLLAGLAGGVSEAPGEEDVPELYRQVASSCVTLHLETHIGEERTGRGFLFDEQTAVTSRNVLLGCTAGTIEFHDGQRSEICGVVADDPRSDLALLRFRPAISNARVLEVATDPPRSGERVAFIGSPPGPACVLAEGVVTAPRPHPIYGACAELEAEGIRGARGSPLIDMGGRIVGVVVASLPGEQSLSLAVDSGRVGELHPSEVVRLRKWNHIPGKRAQEYIDAGDRMFMAGDFKAAIYLYEMADKFDRGCASAVSRIMHTLLYTEEPGRANEIGLVAAQRWPTYRRLWRWYYFSERTSEEARLARARKWVKSCPEDPEAYEMLAEGVDRARRYVEYEAAIATAVLVDPDGIGALEERVHDLWFRGMGGATGVLDEARSRLQGLRSPENPVRCAGAYLTLLRYHNIWGEADWEHERDLYVEGMEFVLRCLDDAATSPQRTRLLRAASELSARFGSDLMLREAEKRSPRETELALDALRTALRYARERPHGQGRLAWGDITEAWCHLDVADALLELGRLTEAQTHIDAVMRVPETKSCDLPLFSQILARAWGYRGDVASGSKEWPRAIRAYLTAMRLAGKPVAHISALARALLSAGASPSGDEGLEDALQRMAEHRMRSEGEETFVIGMAYLRINEVGEALETLSQLKQDDPELAERLLKAVHIKLHLELR